MATAGHDLTIYHPISMRFGAATSPKASFFMFLSFLGAVVRVLDGSDVVHAESIHRNACLELLEPVLDDDDAGQPGVRILVAARAAFFDHEKPLAVR